MASPVWQAPRPVPGGSVRQTHRNKVQYPSGSVGQNIRSLVQYPSGSVGQNYSPRLLPGIRNHCGRPRRISFQFHCLQWKTLNKAENTRD